MRAPPALEAWARRAKSAVASGEAVGAGLRARSYVTTIWVPIRERGMVSTKEAALRSYEARDGDPETEV